MSKSSDKIPEVQFVTEPTFDQDGVQATAGIDRYGREQVDSTPLAPPIGYSQPPDLMTMIRTMIQSEEIRRNLALEEFETFEESDDFDIPDDPLDPHTPYEAVFDPVPTPPVPLKPAVPPAPSPSPEVLDTSGLGDTSPEPKKEPPAPKKLD